MQIPSQNTFCLCLEAFCDAICLLLPTIRPCLFPQYTLTLSDFGLLLHYQCTQNVPGRGPVKKTASIHVPARQSKQRLTICRLFETWNPFSRRFFDKIHSKSSTTSRIGAEVSLKIKIIMKNQLQISENNILKLKCCVDILWDINHNISRKSQI